MSVQSSAAVRGSGPASALSPQPQEGIDASFDARWAARIESGRQHDVAVRRKVRLALLGAAIIGVPAALFFGLTAGAR